MAAHPIQPATPQEWAEDKIQALKTSLEFAKKSDESVQKILGKEGYTRLHGEAEPEESITARKLFIEAISQLAGDKLLKPTVVTLEAQPLDTIAKAHGVPNLKKLYEDAIREERESRAYKNAAFLKSTEVYEGGNFEQQRVILIAGPSGVGKSSVRAELVRTISQGTLDKSADSAAINPDTHHLVVSVDGGIEREVSYVRDLMNKASLKLGYAGVEDLEEITTNATKGSTKLKKHIEAAADAAKLNLVIPTTHPSDDLDHHMQPNATKDVSFVNVAGNKDVVKTIAHRRAFAKKNTSYGPIDNMIHEGDETTKIPESKKPGNPLSFAFGTQQARAGEQDYIKRQLQRGKKPDVLHVQKDLVRVTLVKTMNGVPVDWRLWKAGDPAPEIMTARQLQAWKDPRQRSLYAKEWAEKPENIGKAAKLIPAEDWPKASSITPEKEKTELTRELITRKGIQPPVKIEKTKKDILAPIKTAFSKPKTYEISARSSDVSLKDKTVDGFEDVRIALSSVVSPKESNEQVRKDLLRSTNYTDEKTTKEQKDQLKKDFVENPKAYGLHQGLWADVMNTFTKNFNVTTPEGTPCPLFLVDSTTQELKYIAENGIYAHTYDVHFFPATFEDPEKAKAQTERIKAIKLDIDNNIATPEQHKELADIYKKAVHITASVSIDTRHPDNEAQIKIQITPGADCACAYTNKRGTIPGISTPQSSFLSSPRKWLSKKMAERQERAQTTVATPEPPKDISHPTPSATASQSVSPPTNHEPVSRKFPPERHLSAPAKPVDKITPTEKVLFTPEKVNQINQQIKGLAELEMAPTTKGDPTSQLLHIKGRDPIGAVEKCPELQKIDYVLEISALNTEEGQKQAKEHAQTLLKTCDHTKVHVTGVKINGVPIDKVQFQSWLSGALKAKSEVSGIPPAHHTLH